MRKRVVIKVGTKVICDENGVLSIDRLKIISEQIIKLKNDDYEVILVSSGAMGTGKALLKTNQMLSDISKKQLYSAVGQPHLIEQYSQIFRVNNYLCAQVLATKEDFRDRIHFFNMRNCLETLLHDDIIPVMNENDVVSIEELTFTDNDELAGLVASMLDVDKLIILSSVDGLMGKVEDIEKIVDVVERDDQEKLLKLITPDKSEAGRGGMTTKYRVAKNLANQGIEVVITSGFSDDAILDAVNDEGRGTRFIPGKRLSNIKRRIALSDNLVEGKVVINQGAQDKIASEQGAFSLLFVGIVHIEGDFVKGSILEIFNEDGKKLGHGMSQYDFNEAKEKVGKKNSKPLIHYDYMFVE